MKIIGKEIEFDLYQFGYKFKVLATPMGSLNTNLLEIDKYSIRHPKSKLYRLPRGLSGYPGNLLKNYSGKHYINIQFFGARKVNNQPIENILGIDLSEWTLEQLRFRYLAELRYILRKNSLDPYVGNAPNTLNVGKKELIGLLRHYLPFEKEGNDFMGLCEVV